MEVITDINIMREKLKRLNTTSIGIVQAKSFLHEGHTDLLRMARSENYIVIAVKLINSEEFVSEEAATLYPSDVPCEMDLVARTGVDFFFMPPLESLYPRGRMVRLQLRSPLATMLGGSFKDNYYELKLQTTCILCNMLQPKRLYLSDKDLQLVYFTRQLLHDLFYEIELRVAPRIRDEEGVTLSNKLSLLKEDEKNQLLSVYKILQKAKSAVGRGMTNCRKLKWYIENEMNDLYLCKMAYVEIVEVERLTAIETIVDEAYVMLGVRVGKVRISEYEKVSIK